MNIITKKNIKLITLAVFVFISGVLITFQSLTKEEFIVKPFEEEKYFEITDEIKAESAIIYDIKNDKIVAGKNVKDVYSIASITKLTSAIIAYSFLSGEDKTIINSDDFKLASNTPLKLGDSWNSLELLEYSLITSSNRGISAIGRTIEEKTGKNIVDLMNDFVYENGLVQTHFINPTGLDTRHNLSGSESSAYELAKLVSIIIQKQNEVAKLTTNYKKTFYTEDGDKYVATNTNILLKDTDKKYILSKTGFTDIAGGALIVAVSQFDGDYIYVVLNSTKNGRFSDIKKLFLIKENIDEKNKNIQ